jgi:hypothetical protein
MLIIKPIQDKDIQKDVCRACGFNFDPTLFAYSEKEDEKLIAGCQFDILGSEAIITDFGMSIGAEEDIEALIILGRAVLNFLDLSGVKTCRFETGATTNEKYAKMIGFKKEDGKMVITLEGLFDSKCAHCK